MCQFTVKQSRGNNEEGPFSYSSAVACVGRGGEDRIEPVRLCHCRSCPVLAPVDICNAGTCVWVQKLAVVIDGKKYEIRDPAARVDLLRTGDYKAKMLKEETTRPYEYQLTYEFMFVDGKTRRYEVVGEME